MKTDLITATPAEDSETASPPQAAGGRVSGDVFRIVAPLVILVGGLVGFVALKSLKAIPASEVRPPTSPLVETVAVRPHEGGMSFSVDGVVVPFREINLSAEIAGRIAKKAKACRAGTFVTQGTPLIEIDPRDNELEVKRLQGEVAQADVMIEELDVEVKNSESLVELADGQLELHRNELQRVQSLADKGYSTSSELDRNKREELTAMNAVMTLKNQLQLLATRRHRLESARDLSRTQLEKAQLDLDRTKIVAPIDGVVVMEMVEEDTYVQKGASLVTMEDTAAVEVRCNLRMDQLMWLFRGNSAAEASEEITVSQRRDYQIPPAPVTVGFDLAGRRYEWQGVLSRFDGIGVDERTRTVPCRALVANPRKVRLVSAEGDPVATSAGPPALVRGMYVNVRVQAPPSMPLLEIPERALHPGNKVWEVVDGHLTIKRVRVAHTDNDVVLIHSDGSDLRPGARLISSPLALAEEGMSVQERALE